VRRPNRGHLRRFALVSPGDDDSSGWAELDCIANRDHLISNSIIVDSADTSAVLSELFARGMPNRSWRSVVGTTERRWLSPDSRRQNDWQYFLGLINLLVENELRSVGRADRKSFSLLCDTCHRAAESYLCRVVAGTRRPNGRAAAEVIQESLPRLQPFAVSLSRHRVRLILI
jgi:hypothetical protein